MSSLKSKKKKKTFKKENKLKARFLTGANNTGEP
jgi:hypothetical protein